MSILQKGIPVTLAEHGWDIALNHIKSRRPAPIARRFQLAHRQGIARRNGSRTAWIDPMDAEVALDTVEWLSTWFPRKGTSPAEERALQLQLQRAVRNLAVPRQLHPVIMMLADLAA